eukprot:3606256-Rhodomonas_salina.1
MPLATLLDNVNSTCHDFPGKEKKEKKKIQSRFWQDLRSVARSPDSNQALCLIWQPHHKRAADTPGRKCGCWDWIVWL